MIIDRKKGNSLLMSIFISESLICNMIDSVISIPKISFFLMSFLGAMSFYLNRRLPLSAVRRIGISWLSIFTLLILSAFINGFAIVSNYMFYFLVFASVAALLAIHDLSITNVFENLTLIYTLYFVMYYALIRHRFLNSGEDYYYMYSMGIAYSMTTIVYLAIICYFFRRDIQSRNEFKPFLYIDAIIALALILLDCRSRGSVLCIVISLVLLLLMRVKGLKKLPIVIILGIGTAVCVHYFLPFIVWLNSFLNRHDIYIAALGKVIYLNTAQGGLLNGRGLYYSLAVRKIKENIFFGHGVGYFETFGMGYVHNLLLDILLSVGVIGLIFIGGFFIYYSYRIMFHSKKIIQAYMILLFFVGIFILLFSSSLWLYPPFWAFFFGMINISQRDNARVYFE